MKRDKQEMLNLIPLAIPSTKTKQNKNKIYLGIWVQKQVKNTLVFFLLL